MNLQDAEFVPGMGLEDTKVPEVEKIVLSLLPILLGHKRNYIYICRLKF